MSEYKDELEVDAPPATPVPVTLALAEAAR